MLVPLIRTGLVDEIWSLDCASNGDSGLLNREILGDTFSWIDLGRDIASFLLRYLPPKGTGDLPLYLAEQPVDPTLLELDFRTGSSTVPQPWRGHTLIGVGQSFGGAGITLAEVACPGLFSAFAFLDAMLIHPVIEDMQESVNAFYSNSASNVLARRDQCVASRLMTKY